MAKKPDTYNPPPNGTGGYSDVGHLPASQFSTVEVSHRGEVTVHESELGNVGLTLGGG